MPSDQGPEDTFDAGALFDAPGTTPASAKRPTRKPSGKTRRETAPRTDAPAPVVGPRPPARGSAGDEPTASPPAAQPASEPDDEPTGTSGDRTAGTAAGRAAAFGAVPNPSTVSASGGHGKKFALSGIGISVLLVAAVVLTFSLLASIFPWLSSGGDDTDTTDPAAAAPGSRVATTGAPTPAETVVGAVIEKAPSSLSTWDHSDDATSVTAPSLGFGCDPQDGLSPTVARTRTYTDGDLALAVSLRAYPAGGGAVALDGISAASLRCVDSSNESPALQIGVETLSMTSSTLDALVWRRGDVLVIVTGSQIGRASSPAAFPDALNEIDALLDAELRPTCLDQEAGIAAAARSPYLNREGFTGYTKNETVTRPAGKVTRAEKKAKRAAVPVVPIPAPAKSPRSPGSVPTAPNPLPTDGPAAVPDPVGSPVAPSAPTEPAARGTVSRQVEDTEGPGCGWAFTGQDVPVFDATAADASYADAVSAEEKRLTASWRRWQKARLAYWTSYDAYSKKVKKYARYGTELAAVRSAWKVIEDARADYATAVTAWQTAVDDRDAWLLAKLQAKDDYRAAKKACRNASSSTPSGTPTGPGAGTPSPRAPQGNACPPVRPAILDEPTPDVPTSPVPAPEAQLP